MDPQSTSRLRVLLFPSPPTEKDSGRLPGALYRYLGKLPVDNMSRLYGSHKKLSDNGDSQAILHLARPSVCQDELGRR